MPTELRDRTTGGTPSHRLRVASMSSAICMMGCVAPRRERHAVGADAAAGGKISLSRPLTERQRWPTGVPSSPREGREPSTSLRRGGIRTRASPELGASEHRGIDIGEHDRIMPRALDCLRIAGDQRGARECACT